MIAPLGPGDGLTRVLSEIDGRGCQLLPPVGPPLVPAGLVVPDELHLLYQRCDGAMLFEGDRFAWRVSGPHELVAASPRLLTRGLANDIAASDPADLTNGCYVIADGGTGTATEPHIVIDRHPRRAGRCSAVHWDTYGLVGEMPIVANGIAELLHWLLETRGTQATPPGPYYGDAYDQ